MCLQDAGLVTAAAFLPDNQCLVVGTSGNQIAVYDVASMRPTQWTQDSGVQLPKRLLQMPGQIASIAVHPDPEVRGVISAHLEINICSQ